MLQKIKICKEILESINLLISVEDLSLRLSEIDLIINDPSIWKDQKRAVPLMKERQKILDTLNIINSFIKDVEFYDEFSSLFPEELNEHASIIIKLYEHLSDFEFKQLMNNEADDNAAILSINAGAGGLEAANWVSILLRMYCRWADNLKYKIEILDMKPSEEHSAICTDSVSIRIDGPYVYGYLKGESGVHRLIRNSPFNSGDARHTSFAAVYVTPDIEDTIDIKIEEKDLEITAQTSCGSGGQNVNKVASAIRLKHTPSGINILVRSERDQLANRKIAMKMLKSKLYAIELKKREDEKNKILSAQQDIAFGSQIRTYTLTPYQLVKDHKSSYESRNADSVLDGNIQDFIFSHLKHSFVNL
jgi:peptide chain release factor 2